MKLSKAQETELDCLAYFNGTNKRYFSDDEIEAYFKWSEHGIGNGGDLSVMKQMRGVMMGEYEKGILEGSTPYYGLLGGLDGHRRWWQFWKEEFYPIAIPRCAVDFMKKELFKGIDAELIENLYQQIIQEQR